MCFNAAKTWWFGWFSSSHRTVRLSTSQYTGVVVSPAESNLAGSNDILLRVLSEGNGNKDLYIVFNLAAGANAGVVGSRNQVVIIEQASATAESRWMAGLSVGESWQKSNWGSGTIVVKNCGINWSTPTTAKIVIAYSSSSALNCNNNVMSPPIASLDNISTTGEIPEIFDDTSLFKASRIEAPIQSTEQSHTICKDISGWHDSDGPSYNCEWYASMDTDLRCRHSKRHPNNGHTALTACCACGGGEDVQSTVEECHNEPGWYDSKGKDCGWYEVDYSRCINRGHKHINKGKTANEACCFCELNR
jgi:hypothetical protein